MKSQVKPAQMRAKNGQIISVSKNPASPEAESILMPMLPAAKLDRMLNNSHSSRLPRPNP